jgi:hypothetical protein
LHRLHSLASLSDSQTLFVITVIGCISLLEEGAAEVVAEIACGETGSMITLELWYRSVSDGSDRDAAMAETELIVSVECC